VLSVLLLAIDAPVMLCGRTLASSTVRPAP
jgi:hypothetical protein